ncbi:winged helix-turn-helix domain-containing protein [Rhizobium sp. WYJ-E13]|uniref:winged helix-turn-helix domain-containing protein n=1 Tax=Rhizobium sp. WYJ-E13 TaxID=2849093 RepID=UPI001C1EE16C|nr:winged helix-turn-helix domain-containing protein [Rhizobium sp. WYJ-E13]QWW72294.1 winged helix-turn-helix domain-containing protein [Rhizobium sp. WYJ-E13]
MKHILVVDDDSKLRNLLIDYLSQHAFRVSGVKDNYQLQQVLQTDPVDLFIVDLNLGHEDGLEIVRTLSGKSDAPIIIISGDRQEETDKVVGLELGACDYVTKPFGLREFLARVRAALRTRPATVDRKDRKIYTFAGWTLSVKKRQLLNENEAEVRLTAGEFNLLVAFLKSPREVLSREQLLAASRVHDEEIFDRSIDVLILRLRRKLEADPSNPVLIRTERGVGYMFDAQVTVEDKGRARP